MLEKEEYREVKSSDGRLYIMCDRLDMFPDIEEQLLAGAVISVQCPSTEQSALAWLRKFQELTKTTFSVMATGGEKTKNAWVLHHKRLQCQHYERTASAASKKGMKSARDAACKVILHVRIRKVTFKAHASSRSKKPDAGYALTVRSNGERHSHNTDAASALKFRRVSDATKERLISLFKHYHSPATALETLKLELQAEHGEDYALVCADRAMVPDPRYVHDLFRKVFQAEYGKQELDQKGLEEQLKTIVQDADGVAVHSENGELFVAAVTPLMAGAHDLPEAGETVFVDASGHRDWPTTWFAPLAGVSELAEPPASADGAATVGLGAEVAGPPGNDAPEAGDADRAGPSRPSEEQAAEAERAEVDLETFKKFLVDNIATGRDWAMWATGLRSFMRRWNGATTAAKQSFLHGTVPARGRNATRIGVQPTATARRRSCSLRGRGRVPAGRPAKIARTAEHGYGATSARRSAAPHSLSECVSANRALGR